MCSQPGCEKKSWAKGYCSNHYYSAQRNGLLPRAKCSVPDCSGPSFRKGMCNKHHLRTERYGDPSVVKKAANGTNKLLQCKVSGCDGVVRANGFCSVHNGRLRNHGDPLAEPKKLGNGQSTPERQREKANAAMRRYNQTPAGKMRRRFANARRRILDGARSAHLDRDQFLDLWARPCCALCGHQMTDDDKSLDHKIPLARGGSNDFDNLQMAHLICNQRKSDRIAA